MILSLVAYLFAAFALVATAAYPGAETWTAVVVFGAIGLLAQFGPRLVKRFRR